MTAPTPPDWLSEEQQVVARRPPKPPCEVCSQPAPHRTLVWLPAPKAGLPRRQVWACGVCVDRVRFGRAPNPPGGAVISPESP